MKLLAPRPPRPILLGCLLACLLAGAGCQTVGFHEKRAFSDPVMTFQDDPTAVHLLQKATYSMEGSAGGIGTSAGGGCGCY